MSDHAVVELALAIGAALLIVGVAVIYWPAAMITAGLRVLAALELGG